MCGHFKISALCSLRFKQNVVRHSLCFFPLPKVLSPQQHINAVGSGLIGAQQAIRLKRFHATKCTYRCEITVRGTEHIKTIQSVQRIGCFINLPTHQSAAGYEDSKAPSIADAALQRKALLSYEHSFFTARPGPSGLVTKPCLSHAVQATGCRRAIRKPCPPGTRHCDAAPVIHQSRCLPARSENQPPPVRPRQRQKFRSDCPAPFRAQERR